MRRSSWSLAMAVVALAGLGLVGSSTPAHAGPAGIVVGFGLLSAAAVLATALIVRLGASHRLDVTGSVTRVAGRRVF